MTTAPPGAVPPAAPTATVAKPLRIKTLTLTDFRAFPGPAPQAIEFGGKNLLVYGENGSGKSSLFYALTDFFSVKNTRSLREYKNVFSGAPETSCAVEVEFTDSQKAARWETVLLPAPTPVAPGVVAKKYIRERHPARAGSGVDTRVVQAALRRACLDYRSLLDTNYKHGNAAINLFEIAVNHLLADFPVPVSGGTSQTLGDLWRGVERAKPIKHTTSALAAVNLACANFNAGFNAALAGLHPIVGDLLAELIGADVTVAPFAFGGVTYTPAYYKRDRGISGMTLAPDISFRSHKVAKPQHFLNEARLSALALAIYLAGRIACTPTATAAALKLLVLDDVLIGLDLANRLPLLRVLERRFVEQGWQVVLLTFDRPWYDVARQRLRSDQWRHYEIFAARVGDHEQPLVLPDEHHLYRALEFLNAGQVKAAAVHVRTAFELALKHGCHHLGLQVKYNPDPRKVSASDLWAALKAADYDTLPSPNCGVRPNGTVYWWQPKPQKLPVVAAALQGRIEHAVSWILNPLSHSQSVEHYRAEVEDAIYAVDELETAIKVAMAMRSLRPMQLIGMLATVLQARAQQLKLVLT